MKYLKIFEEFNKRPFSELDIMEVENYLLEWSDRGDIEVGDFAQYLNPVGWITTPSSIIFKDYGRIFDLYSDKFDRREISRNDISGLKSITFIAEVPHPGGMRGSNLDLDGYTRDILNHYLKKIHNNFDVDIYIQIQETNPYNDIISKSRVVITPKQNELNESYQDETKEYIESFFVELSDHKDDEYPITVNVYKRRVNKYVYDGYQVYVEYDNYDKAFIENKKKLIKKRLEPEFTIGWSSTDKIGVRWKDIPVHGTDRTSRVADPIWRWTIVLYERVSKVQEKITGESNLIIVDVQKSFKKWFNEKYVNELKKYASQFTNVYQIWDNHHQGKNVDKDYLYDKDPEIPIDKDLYTFPNQKELIEKRYNYDVDADFYKKVLDKETYNKIKATKLKKGDYFPTTEGTIIVYIGNNHQWFHVPVKLYKLLKSLVGKQVTIVGGSDSECLEDIVTTCESLGVSIKRDWKYIYSASHCPIN